jgi:hypothetical protein
MTESPATASLNWTASRDGKNFFQKVYHASRHRRVPPDPDRIELRMDSGFLDAFLRLNDEAASQVLNTLEATPVVAVVVRHVTLSGPTRLDFAKQEARLLQLFQVLGSKIDLKTATFWIDPRNGISHDMAVEHLPYLSSLVICGRHAAHTVPSERLSSGIQNHPMLSEVRLELPNRCVRSLMAALRLRPSLERLIWSRNNVPSPVPAPFEDVQALSTLLQSETVSQPHFLGHVTLMWIDLSRIGCEEELCKGLAMYKGRGVKIQSCSFGSPVQLAYALSNARVTKMDIRDLYFDSRYEHDLAMAVAFLTTFATQLPRMTELEELHLSGNNFANESGLIQILRSVSIHPRIKTISLVMPDYTDPVDEALADCVRNNSLVQSITVSCRSFVGPYSSCEKSLLLKAMEKNFTLLHIEINAESNYMSSNPLITALQTNLDAICRLNKHRRDYLSTDSADKMKGVAVLNAVSDDMNCLYYHLLENPLLGQFQKDKGRPVANASMKWSKANDYEEENSNTVRGA